MMFALSVLASSYVGGFYPYSNTLVEQEGWDTVGLLLFFGLAAALLFVSTILTNLMRQGASNPNHQWDQVEALAIRYSHKRQATQEPTAR